MPFKRGRMDFVVETRRTGSGDEHVEFALVPDPRRYEWVERNGERLLYDKLDHVAFGPDVLERLCRMMEGKPIYFEPPAVADGLAYANGRREPVATALDGRISTPTFRDISDELLKSLPDGDRDFVVMSVDVVGSTALATELPGSDYARIFVVVLNELSRAVPIYRGHVLKYTGDGVLAYFPAPSYNTKHELAPECALTLLRLVALAINPELAVRGLPPVRLRIGLESGTATVVTIGDESTKQQKDLLGATISLACKIQARAPVNGIALSEETYRGMHTNWKLRCRALDAGPNWQTRIGGRIYRLYSIDLPSDIAPGGSAEPVPVPERVPEHPSES